MFDYTYSLPFNENKFAEIIITELKRKDAHQVAHLLKDSKVSLNNTGIYSNNVGGGRWNAYAVYIEIYVNPNNIDTLCEKNNKDIILSICNSVIPANVGYDLKDIEFFPDYSIAYDNEVDLVEDLVNTSKSQSKKITEIFSGDLMNKGFEMSEAYIYMYAIENSLRQFVEKVCIQIHGENYFDSIKLTKRISSKIESRKKDAAAKQWLSFNSNSDMYYLDFIELGDIIKENWSDFKDYFPEQEFIIPKINEIADARNRIAHNSYIGDTERIMLKAYYRMILGQILK